MFRIQKVWRHGEWNVRSVWFDGAALLSVVILALSFSAAARAAGPGALSSLGVVNPVSVAVAPRPRANDEAREVAYLMQKGTADSLATASLLTRLIETNNDSEKKPDSTALLRRALALAPNRPELVWLQLRDCELDQCKEEKYLVARLHGADPDNGLTLLPALNASRAGSPGETTRIIAQIGASKYLTVYWNKLLAATFDALTHEGGHHATSLTYNADDRLSHASSVLTAVDITPFKPILVVCAADQFSEPGRREACESLMARLDHSDSIIAQSLSVTVQQKWGLGNAQLQALRAKGRQQHYLVEASGRDRGAQVNTDALMRVELMRHLATEEEVGQAMLTAFHEPLQRPDDWTGAVAAQ